MTWSYDPTMASDLDRVRFAVGDTVAEDPQLVNEEISYLLTSSGSVVAASRDAAAALAAKYSRLVDVSHDGRSQQYSQRVEHYQKLAEKLGSRAAAVAVPGLSAGAGIGTGTSGPAAEPFFTRTTHDMPGGTVSHGDDELS